MSTVALIFSYNRALQLDATLRSLLFHCRDISESQINILYKTDSELHLRQYEKLKHEYRRVGNIHFHEETQFKANVINLLTPFKYVLFLVDDNIFVDAFRVKDLEDMLEAEIDAIGISLRLGFNTTYCYSLDCKQSIPKYEIVNRQFLKFSWVNAEADFGYPLEVSSSVYRLDRLLPLLQQIRFQNPNTLEAALHASKEIFRASCPSLLSYKSSRTFCAPLNKVQTVAITNRVGHQPAFSVEELAVQYKRGGRVDIAAYVGFQPNACHQEIDLRLMGDGVTSKDSDPTTHEKIVSVIVPCYNQAHWVTETLISVIAQSYKHWECIVVNDGSSDNTSEVVRNIIRDHADCAIKLLEVQNGGLSSARNRGIEAARGEYILPLDSDDTIHPNYLQRCVEVLNERPDISIVYCDRQDFGISEQRVHAADFNFNRLINGNIISYCSMYRKKVWEDAGGYDESMNSYEDWNFWISAAKKGHKGFHIKEFLFYYRVKEHSMYTDALKRDGHLKAQIVLNHPELYSRQTVRDAQRVRSVAAQADQSTSTEPGNVVTEEHLIAVAEQAAAAGSLPTKAHKTNRPMVSVIVPTFNRPDTLVNALRSILDQTYKDFEIIVVNDAGSDVENIVRFLDKEGRITYIRHGSNRNLAAARNTGISIARGKYIAYLDDDDLYYPDHLETLVAYLHSNKSKVAYTDAHRAHQERQGGRYVVTKRDIPYSVDFDYDRILVQNFVPVLCFMHERSCLDTVGLFDELLTTHEDWEMWIRMSRRFQFAHIKKVTCEFTSRTDGSTMSSSKHSDFLRTYAIILERYKASVSEKPHVRAVQERILQELLGRTAEANVITPPVGSQRVAALLQQADEYCKTGELQKAKESLEQALKICSGDPQLIVTLGNIILRLGDVEGARREFIRATALRPGYAPAHADLAAVLMYLGLAAEAEASARRALELDSTNISALKVLAKVCLETERYREAVQAYATILQHAPDDIETLTLVGNCYAETGQFERAQSFYRKVLERDPGNQIAIDNLTEIGRLSAAAPSTIETDAVNGAGSNDDRSASIVVVTYNSASTIRACLDSVLGESRPKIELIIVDNASTDATRAILETYRDRATVFLNTDNAGFSAACNQGIRASGGEYVVLLNPDTVVTPGWLDRLIGYFGPGVGAVGPISDYAAELQNLDRNLPNGAPKSMGLQEVTDLLGQANNGKARETKLLTGFCLMLPRRVLDDVGLLDEDLFLGNDDLDLSWRLRLKGYRLLVATDTFVHHEGQVSFKSEPSTRTAKLVQESTDRLHVKLETYYGVGKVPSPMELWGIDWFKPTQVREAQGVNSEAPLTSVIVLTHNGLEHTKKCLASIETHTPEPHELIIVDNSSTDGTLDYLRDYVAAHNNVRVIANQTNRGFAAGNNQGLALARGEYVLLLNNDTIVTTGWLRRMLRVCDAHPDVGIVGPMSNYVSGPQLVRDASYKGPEGVEAFAVEWAQSHDGQSREATRVVGFCLLARKQVIERIGGLDEQFGSGNFEDDDFCIRAFQAGLRARIALDVFIHHTGSQTFKNAKIDYRQSLLRNWGLFKAKWGIPADTPYDKGYRFPPEGAPSLFLRIPLPDVSADHRCEVDVRWWQEIDEDHYRREPAVPDKRRFDAVIVPNGHGLAPLWPSLVQHTNYPLAVTIVPSTGNGHGSVPPRQSPCPEDWQITTTDMSVVRVLNRLLQSAGDDPVIVLSGDVVVTPGWLKRLLIARDRDPHLAMVGPAMNSGLTPQQVKADYRGTGKALRQFGVRRAHQYGKQLAVTESLAPFCIVFNPAVCRCIGPLREDLDLTASLADYFVRINQSGHTLGVALGAYVHCEKYLRLNP